MVREMGDFIRCVRQSFNEMLHDENYQVGILLAIFFALLFLPIFNVQGHFALKMQITMVIATIVSLPFLLMFVFALDNSDLLPVLKGGGSLRAGRCPPPAFTGSSSWVHGSAPDQHCGAFLAGHENHEHVP